MKKFKAKSGTKVKRWGKKPFINKRSSLAILGCVLVLIAVPSIYLIALRVNGKALESSDSVGTNVSDESDKLTREGAETTDTEQEANKPDAIDAKPETEVCNEEEAESIKNKGFAEIRARSAENNQAYKDALDRYNQGLISEHDWNIIRPMLSMSGSREIGEMFDSIDRELQAISCPILYPGAT